MKKEEVHTEKYIEAKVSEYARSKGVLVYKFSSFSNKGVPDRIFIAHKNKVFFIEFKTNKGVTTKLQDYHIRLFRDKGAAVHVVHGVEEGCQVVDLYA